MDNSAQLERERLLLTGWLLDAALPLWWTVGADRAQGGFFEKIDRDGRPTDDPRRTRVVARQIYCYASAIELGWSGPARVAVDHGLDYYFSRCLARPGALNSVMAGDGAVLSDRFELYDHAFALFGLAAAAKVGAPAGRLAGAAVALRDAMLRGWRNAAGGVHEAMPPAAPLKSNPHMHLLEACLAWMEADPHPGYDGWGKLADHIVALCLARMIDPDTGALREFFDLEWNPHPGESGRIVEPGHQFEWAWLLLRWGGLRRDRSVRPVALRLIANAERHGVAPGTGLAINELWDDFSVKDADSRLWPQTERIKAHLAAAELTEGAARGESLAHAASACQGLRRFLAGRPQGAWTETFDHRGAAVAEPARASSLYHIVGAVMALSASRFAGTAPRADEPAGAAAVSAPRPSP